MNKRADASITKQIAIALSLITLILLALKFVALANDPPLYFVDHGQSLLTDPYHLTFHARQKTLFDNSNLFGIHRWDNFKNSLVSGLAYLTFALGGVSRVTANLAAVLLSIGGILLFSLGIYRQRGQMEALLTLLLLGVNHLLFFYGRYPFLENGLIFLSGALFYVYLVHGKSIVGQVSCGLLIALAALAGKLFGLLLFAPVLVALIYDYRRKALMPSLFMFGGAVAGAALYALIFFGGDMTLVFSYYHEQTTGMYGLPPGFRSPLSFVKMLFTYGGESGLYQYQPVWLTLAVLALILATLVAPTKLKRDNKFNPLAFCAVWLLVGIVGLSPFLYRPLRYALFLMLPAGALSAFLIAQLMTSRLRLQSFHRWGAPIVAFAIIWYLLIQIVMLVSPDKGRFATGVATLPMTGLVSAGIAALFGMFFKRVRRLKIKPYGRVVVGLVAAAMFANQCSYLYRGLVKPGRFLQEYDQDLTEIVADNAVITGPYAPALTIDNTLKSIIYMFGLSNVDSSLFSDHPITHVAAEASNWQLALRDFPQLKSAQLVAEMVVRDQAIRLYRVADSAFPTTDFERAAALLTRNRPDSAKAFLTIFLQKHPYNLFARMSMITATLGAADTISAPTLLAKLVADYPDNYYALAYALGMYRRLAGLTRSQQYLLTAEMLRQRVAQLNPHMPTGRITKFGR